MPDESTIKQIVLIVLIIIFLIAISIGIYYIVSNTNDSSTNSNISPSTNSNNIPSTNSNTSSSTNPSPIISGSSMIGLCYAYDRTKYTGNKCIDFEKLIGDDFRKIKAAGYNYVKTYWGYFGGEYGCLCDYSKGGMYAKVANDTGLGVVLGLNPSIYPKDQWGFDVRNCILESISKNPGAVRGIIVGNENVNGDINVARKIIEVYNDLKTRISTNIPIGTAQQNGFWVCMNNPTKGFCKCNTDCQAAYKLLYNTLDFCGANIYAYPFPGSNNKELNKKTLIDQFNELLPILGKKLWITETGIPHSGGGKTLSSSVSVTFTRDIQADLIGRIMEWHNVNKDVPIFLFEAFDEPSKPDNVQGLVVEKYFGIIGE